MSDNKRFELFTDTLPVDLAEPFDPVQSTADGLHVTGRLSGDGNHVHLRPYPRPFRPGERRPDVLVSLDSELSDNSDEELAAFYADLAVYYIRRVDVDGGVFEDLDECRYLTWQRGDPVVLNAHPFMETLPLGRALVAALSRAGVGWVGQDMGLYLFARAWFVVERDAPPYPPELWSATYEEGMAVYTEIEELAAVMGLASGIVHPRYETFVVHEPDLVVFAERVLAGAAADPGMVERYRSTIVRLVAMALAAGFQLEPADPVAAELVAEARALD